MIWKLVGATGALLLGACAQRTSTVPQAGPGAQAGSPFILTATIKELMDSIVDPSADVVWESVAFNATQVGVDEHKPRTDEDWQAVRRGAITLISRPTFIAFAKQLNATAKTALDAIDRKDAEALFAVGGAIDSACEACHLTYWYPEAPR